MPPSGPSVPPILMIIFLNVQITLVITNYDCFRFAIFQIYHSKATDDPAQSTLSGNQVFK